MLWGRTKIRCKQAVPRRSDRRDLRRSFKVVSRSFLQQQESALTVALARLAARLAPVVAVRPLPAGEEAIEFDDGTRVEVDVRESSTDLRHLAVSPARPLAYLISARPCYRGGWYWLDFAALYGEVIAHVRVDCYESGELRLRRPRDHWLYRLGRPVAKL